MSSRRVKLTSIVVTFSGRVAMWVVAAAFVPPASQAQLQTISFDKRRVFDEVSALVAEHFYDPEFDEEAWRENSKRYRDRALRASDHDGFSAAVNHLLQTLDASHTHYYSVLDPKRYQLLGIFHELYDAERRELFVYDGIGIGTQPAEAGHRVVSVFDGMPAARGGVKFGDHIEAVGGQPFHPICSFAGRAGEKVRVDLVRRGRSLSLEVEVAELDGRTMFSTALGASMRVIKRDGKRVGYVHAWSYAGRKYQDKIREELLWGELSDCEALVLDLRDGWGGADVNYLNLFRPPIVEVQARTRTGDSQNFTGVWGRPVALLTNARTTSGKELFTYGFKKLKLGPVIGETTAGAVLGGRAFLLSNGDVLYLAVVSSLVDGRKLEGQGVAPDIEVQREPNDEVEDAQLDRAVEELVTTSG